MKLISDALGNEFESILTGNIVSLVPSITETLFELGLEDRVVGVTRYCIHPEQAKEKTIIGGTKSPNVQKIRTLKPKIVITNIEENPKDRVEELKKFTTVFVTYPKTIEDSLKMIIDLGMLLLGKIPPEIRTKVDYGFQILKNTPNKKLRTFCPIWKNPWMTINSDTFIHNMLYYAGFNNVFADKEDRYPSLTDEDLTKMDVDVVLLPNEPYEFNQRDIELLHDSFAHLKGIPIITFDGSLISWYGIRTLKGLNFLRDLHNRLISNQ